MTACTMYRFVPIYMLIKIFKKIIQFQPIKSYILWKLMTPTITWPTGKVDNDKVEFLVQGFPEFLEVPLQGPTCQVHLV